MNSVESKPFGKTKDGTPITVYSLINQRGVKARLIDYGATLISLETPDKSGKLANITLGFPNLDGYLQRHLYFGSTVGRYGNRIAGGKFKLEGKEYTLATNNGPNHLHGGLKGFDAVVWKAEPIKEPSAVGVKFAYTSQDGEEGYPSYTNLGIQFAVTVDLATASSDNVGYKQKVIGNAITLSFLFAAGLALLGVILSGSNLNLFEQYSFNQYALLLMIWVGLFNLQQVLINIYRVYDRLIRIAICEIIFAIIPLLVTLVYRDEALITASLIAMIVSCLSNILILFYTPPFRYTFSFLSGIAWKLIKIGVPLLVYHVSLNMIPLAGRTILGIFYPNEVMGYYSRCRRRPR